ncbi:MAG: hypothetical protein WCX27_00915 [Candidatus Paceibacterota bacterium]|jgi:hypothetical protein
MKKLKGIFPLIAALLVLFSSMWRADVTLVVSITSLILLSIYSFFEKENI